MRNAKKKIATYLLIGIVALTVATVLGAKVSARIYRQRAMRLLHAIRQLQVGKSTFDEARAVIVGHGGGVSPYDHSGCSPAHCTFEVALRHYPLFVDVWGRYLLTERTWQIVHLFPLLGVQDGWGGAEVRVDNGIVTQVGYGIAARGSGDEVLGRTVDEFKVIPEYLQDRMGQRSYFVNGVNITTTGGGEGIESTLTPQASAEERDRAYDIDFDCLTKMGGCTASANSPP